MQGQKLPHRIQPRAQSATVLTKRKFKSMAWAPSVDAKNSVQYMINDITCIQQHSFLCLREIKTISFFSIKQLRTWICPKNMISMIHKICLQYIDPIQITSLKYKK